MRFIQALFTVLVLAGCSHIIAKQEPICVGVDWWEAGRTEGVAGVPLKDALQETGARCEGRIDLDAFQNGHEAGLIDYCTPAQGLALGRNGLPYNKSCPSFLESAFLRNYEAGLKLRSMESQVHVDSDSKTL